MSFGELFIIGVIALIVLGPERLPKAVRTVGLWVGKAKQSFNSIKTEIDRELKIQEIQQQIEQQKQDIEDNLGVESLKQDLSNSEQQLNHLAANLNDSPNSILADSTNGNEKLEQNDKQSNSEQ